MSYTPTSWHKGDKVTTEKLNKIEQGIVDAEQSGSSLPDSSEANNGDILTINNGKPEWLTSGKVFVVSMDAQTWTLDKTWQEIYDAMKNGIAELITEEVAGDAGELYCIPFVGAGYANDTYTVAISDSALGLIRFTATSANGYPVKQS